MFLVSPCSCLCPIHWSQALSREWRCSWSSADRRCSNYIWVINNFIAYYGALILEVLWYLPKNPFRSCMCCWVWSFDYIGTELMEAWTKGLMFLLQKTYLNALLLQKIVLFLLQVLVKFVPQDPLGKWSPLVQVMTWCHKATRISDGKVLPYHIHHIWLWLSSS